jgi:hypothetical protein
MSWRVCEAAFAARIARCNFCVATHCLFWLSYSCAPLLTSDGKGGDKLATTIDSPGNSAVEGKYATPDFRPESIKNASRFSPD